MSIIDNQINCLFSFLLFHVYWKLNFNELSERNYYIRYIIADACNYGIPQHRTRTYIAAFKDFDMCNKFQFPKEQPLKKHIFDIIDRSVKADDSFYLSENSIQYQKMKVAITDENQIYRFSDYGIQKSKLYEKQRKIANVRIIV